MDGRRSALRSALAGAALVIALIAVALSLLPLTAPAGPARSTPAPGPATIDVSLLISGRGAIGGPAESHLYDPQLLVARRGGEGRLRGEAGPAHRRPAGGGDANIHGRQARDLRVPLLSAL